MNPATPIERFERFPEPLQAALVDLAVSMIDTDDDDKSAVMVAADVARLTGNESVIRVMTDLRSVMDAVVLQVQLGVLRRQVRFTTETVRKMVNPNA